MYFGQEKPTLKTRGFQVVNGVSIPEFNDEGAYQLGLRYQHDISEKVAVTFRSSYYDWWLDKTLTKGLWEYESTNFSNDLEAQVSFNEKSSTIFGVNYHIQNARRFKGDKDSFDIGKDNEKTTDTAFYANGNYYINDDLNVVYGARQYESSYKTSDLTNLSLRGGMVYKLKENHYIKLLYGESFRAATYFEKEVNSATVKGNPDLSPEKSISYELIYSMIHKGIKFDLNIYQSEIEDKITRVSIGGGVKQNQNIGTVLFKGVELDSKFRLSEKTFGFAGIAYTEGENKDTGSDLTFTYENMVNFGMSTQWSDNLDLTVSAKYLSEWGLADAYTVFNLGAKYKISSTMQVTFKVDNVLGEEINLPEIARVKASVPTIPQTHNPYAYIGFKMTIN